VYAAVEIGDDNALVWRQPLLLKQQIGAQFSVVPGGGALKV
jgi:hypothetical protein